jgi:hypothetical protein
MYSISLSTIVVFGCRAEFAEYHKSTISGSGDDGIKFIWLVDRRIRCSSRVGRARGDAWKKISKYDINGDFVKIIGSFIEEGDRKNEGFWVALKKSAKYWEPLLMRCLRRSLPAINRSSRST